jgi:putative oxidoreductase
MEHLVGVAFATFPGGRAGAGLLLLRVFVGTAFLFHGYGKVIDIPAFAAEFNLPAPIARLTSYGQVLAGGLMIVGVLTPLASLCLAATMVGATATLIRRGEPFISPHTHSWEASSFYLVAASSVFLLGPRLFSIDALLFAKGGH